MIKSKLSEVVLLHHGGGDPQDKFFLCPYIFNYFTHSSSGPDSSVSIATDYRQGGPGIESQWVEIFRPSRPALGPTQPAVQWG
jgi:hypothetical protein